jgi:hypothetical protein
MNPSDGWLTVVKEIIEILFYVVTGAAVVFGLMRCSPVLRELDIQSATTNIMPDALCQSLTSFPRIEFLP